MRERKNDKLNEYNSLKKKK